MLEGRSGNSGDANDKIKFTGKERDKETNYDYFGARYYDSRIGRWMSVDPLAEKFPDVSSYQFTHNNPINRVDIDGAIDWPLKGNVAVNKRDYKNGAWDLTNTVVRTSTYQDTDRQPGQTNPHIGIDYRADQTEFYSLGDGKVIDVGTTTKGAKYITVEYQGGDNIKFEHISSVTNGLKTGSKVLEGEILGITGKTGTESPHLHIEAKDKKGNRIDPENRNYGQVTNKVFFEVFGGNASTLKDFKKRRDKKPEKLPTRDAKQVLDQRRDED